MTHANAKLNLYGRLLIVQRAADGWTQAQIAAAQGVSRATVSKWLRRYREEGPPGLADRSSRPHRSPRALPQILVSEICRLRRQLGVGPNRLAWELQIPASTIYAVLRRAGLSVLARLDRTTRTVIRYERPYPGALVHLDIKKLGRVPDGGGKRFPQSASAGRPKPKRIGHDCVHVAVDDYSRLAFAEIFPDEKGESAAAFLEHAVLFFGSLGISVERVLTDNGPCYFSTVFKERAGQAKVALRRTRPYRPQTNGKAEAFNKTLQREWAYARPYTTNLQRTEALQTFLDHYNHRRPHTAIGNLPPCSRAVNNLFEDYS